jgi:hypothetical protein
VVFVVISAVIQSTNMFEQQNEKEKRPAQPLPSAQLYTDCLPEPYVQLIDTNGAKLMGVLGPRKLGYTRLTNYPRLRLRRSTICLNQVVLTPASQKYRSIVGRFRVAQTLRFSITSFRDGYRALCVPGACGSRVTGCLSMSRVQSRASTLLT